MHLRQSDSPGTYYNAYTRSTNTVISCKSRMVPTWRSFSFTNNVVSSRRNKLARELTESELLAYQTITFIHGYQNHSLEVCGPTPVSCGDKLQRRTKCSRGLTVWRNDRSFGLRTTSEGPGQIAQRRLWRSLILSNPKVTGGEHLVDDWMLTWKGYDHGCISRRSGRSSVFMS